MAKKHVSLLPEFKGPYKPKLLLVDFSEKIAEVKRERETLFQEVDKEIVSEAKEISFEDEHINDDNKENVNIKHNNPEHVLKRNTPPLPPPNKINTNLLKPFKELVINHVTYIILKELGFGGSSVVYHCLEPDKKQEYAVKSVDLSDQSDKSTFLKEVEMLERLQDCDRIIKMYSYEVVSHEKRMYVVLEKGDKDLFQILKQTLKAAKFLPTYMLIYYWMEMLYAVKEIHERGVIHSDLKPANFLIVEGKIKLIDFGISSCMKNDMTSVVKTVCTGTFNYMSPEAISNDESVGEDGEQKYKISFKSDVWSLGCIFYQLIYGKTPFQRYGNKYTKIVAISDPNHVIDFPEIKHVPATLINTVKSCLKYHMKSRPSIKELIAQYEKVYN